MRFEWDPAKAESNYEKHGVRFETAQLVFDDPLQRSLPQVIHGEERWVTMGLVGGLVVIVVVHTVIEGDEETEETIRIISARKATPAERKGYEQGQ